MRLTLAPIAFAVLLLGAASSDAAPALRQVLLLQSYDRGNLTLDYLTANFRVDLDQRAGRAVNVVQIVVGQNGIAGASEQAIVNYIRSTLTSPPDLIVTISSPATTFARRHRQELFPAAPLLFAAVDERYLSDVPLADNETAVPAHYDFPLAVNHILQVLPQTTQILMVTGTGPPAAFWQRRLEEEFKLFHGRVTFLWSHDLSLPQLLGHAASLPAHSAIFYFPFGNDPQGAAYADERVLAELHAVASAPIFGMQSVMLGAGIVGGPLMSIDDLSRTTADVAIRILDGTPPAAVRVAPQRHGQPAFDWRELKRWQIPENRLPAGSVVRFRGPGLWEAHRPTILTAAGALLIQSFLIAALLYQRRARRRAELESRRSLTLAADASRRQTLSALTSSMGHELSQPLNAMLHNTQALRMLIAANRATDDTMDEILSDIEAQSVLTTEIIDRHRAMLRSRQLDKQPIDLHTVVADAMALVAHDMYARRVQCTVAVPPQAGIVNGDPVLLQQVLVNLLKNAMDAMSDQPPGRRRLSIKSDVRSEEVDLSVCDTGGGLPLHVNGTLFAPFVTTKANGLGIGLTVVRTIVEAHGGLIAAHNNADGGATFTVTLRLSQTRERRSEPHVA